MRALLLALGIIRPVYPTVSDAIRTYPTVHECRSISVEWDLNIEAEPTILRESKGGRCRVAVGALWVNEVQTYLEAHRDDPPTAL